ncbi:DUF1612 domain-containing protein [Microvirga sp. HBU67558]
MSFQSCRWQKFNTRLWIVSREVLLGPAPQVKWTSHWQAVAAAAVAWNAWLDLNLYTRLPWLGLTMAASILRVRGLTDHLLHLAAGFKKSKFRPQGREGKGRRRNLRVFAVSSRRPWTSRARTWRG